jgi:hypothetical protein
MYSNCNALERIPELHQGNSALKKLIKNMEPMLCMWYIPKKVTM